MNALPVEPEFELIGARLRVAGDLGAQEEPNFEAALQNLLLADAGQIVIDLTAVRHLSSSYVRHLATLMFRAKGQGMTVTIRATSRSARVLKMGGLEKLGEIEVAD